MKPQNVLYVLGEKVISTYVQAFIALLIVGPTINISTAEAAGIAAIPAALTALANGLPVVPVGLPFYVDLVLRAVRTYVVSFVGFAVAVPVFKLDYSVLAAAAAAAIPSALAIIKAGLAQHVGSSATGALLPASMDVAPLVGAHTEGNSTVTASSTSPPVFTGAVFNNPVFNTVTNGVPDPPVQG